MLKPIIAFTFFCLCAVYLQSCDLFDSVSKKEELPVATQEGKNTFGCFVNGKLWLPKGNDGTPNLDLAYDPTFNKGTFDLRTYRYINDKDFQYIILFSDSLSSTGTYTLEQKSNQVVTFSNPHACYYSLNDPDVVSNGSVVINRFDLQNQIISGTFEFTLTKPGCDIITVTNGRFDVKF